MRLSAQSCPGSRSPPLTWMMSRVTSAQYKQLCS